MLIDIENGNTAQTSGFSGKCHLIPETTKHDKNATIFNSISNLLLKQSLSGYIKLHVLTKFVIYSIAFLGLSLSLALPLRKKKVNKNNAKCVKFNFNFIRNDINP